MEVKVINKLLDDYNKQFKLKRINYDQVVIKYPNSTGFKTLHKNDVELIPETEVDEFLIDYKDFLKVKLNRGISVFLYKGILEVIEEQLKIKFVSLDILKDKYTINRKGIWEKNILGIINKEQPVKITANGLNFKKTGFNIIIDRIEKDDFFKLCNFEIEKIEKEIKEKQEIFKRYKNIKEAINPEIEPIIGQFIT